MKIRLADKLTTDSIVDGEGIRTVVWTQGCSHNCEGCHNPETHSFCKGILADTEDLKKEILSTKGQDGITLSGGDPIFQIEASLDLAKFCKQNNLNVWCYTGYTWEELRKMENPQIQEFLQNVDVLVDGKFEKEKRTFSARFRGSSNQKVIDVQESLKQNKIVEKKEEEYIEKLPEEELYGKVKYMFI